MTSKAARVAYRQYKTEDDLPPIMKLIEKDLSEPYSIFTYRYFIYNWPQLCILAYDQETSETVGAIVCRLSKHKSSSFRGYIGMIAVDGAWRQCGIGTQLVRKAVSAMKELQAQEVVLETEVSNVAATKLYKSLGFVTDKYLNRYYLTGSDAIRLKLWLQ